MNGHSEGCGCFYCSNVEAYEIWAQANGVWPTAPLETWRECAACLDIMAGRRKEPCPQHGAKG